MQKEASKRNRNQLTLFSGGEAVEVLLYEFLKSRSSLTERAYRREVAWAVVRWPRSFVSHRFKLTSSVALISRNMGAEFGGSLLVSSIALFSD